MSLDQAAPGQPFSSENVTSASITATPHPNGGGGDSPQRIVILNAKGGAGKTTLATNLASRYAERGLRTVLFDHDPQNSCSRWLKARPESAPGIHGVAVNDFGRHNVTRTFFMRIPEDTQRVILDTPAGVTAPDLQEHLRGATALLIPVLPSPIDIRAAADFVRDVLLIGKARRQNVRVGIIANRVKPNTLSFEKLERFLTSLRIPVVARLRDTQLYVRAAEEGLGIQELGESRANVERAQWDDLLDWLEAEHTHDYR